MKEIFNKYETHSTNNSSSSTPSSASSSIQSQQRQQLKIKLPPLHEIIPTSSIVPVDQLRNAIVTTSTTTTTTTTIFASPTGATSNKRILYGEGSKVNSSPQSLKRQIPSIVNIPSFSNTQANGSMNSGTIAVDNGPPLAPPPYSYHHPASIQSQSYQQQQQQQQQQQPSNGIQPSAFFPPNGVISQPYTGHAPLSQQHHYQKSQVYREIPATRAPLSAGSSAITTNIKNTPAMDQFPNSQRFSTLTNGIDQHGRDINVQSEHTDQGYKIENSFPPQQYASVNVRMQASRYGNSNSDDNTNGETKKMQVRKRTRTGCLTCRKRRIKCDERKPACLKCERSKKECLGYLSLEESDKLRKRKKK